MRYRIIDKGEVWAKIIEGRVVYLCNIDFKKIGRIVNCSALSVDAIKREIASDKSFFVEDIAPDYDNQQDGE